MKKNMNLYTINTMNEKELFELIKVQVPGLKHTKDKFNRIDCYTEISAIELKCRNTHYSTQLIEKVKWDALIEDGRTPYYIVHTSKKILMFRLAEIAEPEWEVRRMPSTTFFGGDDRIKVVGFIPNTLGQEVQI